ncbi:hypothetical protein [Rhodococcus sp. 077-4]|uniref:MmyB family transcriptional regulator n=1 Tax=Rhodococcus sp. 077-4 TaxID=2789271 RepID=UPI0039F55921
MHHGDTPHRRAQGGSARALEARALEAWAELPAILLDRHLTVLSSTALARAVSPSFFEGVNLAVYTFVDAAEEPCAERNDESREQVVAMLRESLDRHEPDEPFRRIVGELSTRSDVFAQSWAAETSARTSGVVLIPHDVVGPLALTYRQVRADGDHTVVVLHPRSAQSRAALTQLAEAVRESDSV